MMSSHNVWLATVGLSAKFGGIANVARSTLNAIAQADHLPLSKVVSLLDERRHMPPVTLNAHVGWNACSAGRLRFAGAIAAQALQKPRFIVFDHVDLAQCQQLLPRSLRSPYAVWVHGIEVWKDLPKRKRNAIAEADLLLFNSDFTRQRFEQHHRFPYQGSTVHLCCGSAEAASSKVREPRKPWILTVGRLEPDRPKGHVEILAVLPQLLTAIPELHWHVVGAGKNLSWFRDQVQASGCASHVTIHGFIDDDELGTLYRTARVFCMPSRGEGFGLVYLEAMKAGCVPIGSTLDAATEVIGDGGYCVDIDDLASLRDTLVELLTCSESQFETHSRRASNRAEAFTFKGFAQQLTSALNSIGG